jgi:hypothetical protein
MPDAPAGWPEPAGSAEASAEAEVAGADVAAAEPESADLPMWDWSSSDSSDSSDSPDPSGGPGALDDPADEPAAQRANLTRPEWKPVVTPVEEAEGTSRAPGIGEHKGNLAHLYADPRMRVWRLRAIVAVIIMVAFSILFSWPVGLTLAVIAVIADTIYRSRRGSGQLRMTGAQRRTRRQLAKLSRAGYRAMHAGLIPGSEDQIDHLVVGPAGVFAIDSEAWDKRLPVRTKNGKQLWHGPFSKKDRLEHAQWEAQRAAEVLSGATGQPVTVRAVVAVYGPKIHWDVATIREVDVFSGPRLRKYLRRRARQSDVRPLASDEVEQIYKAANKAFPHLSSGSPVS